MMATLASRDERRRPLPGDRVIPDPRAASTQAVTVRVGAAALWPWIAQMGAGRAGWYAWDTLVNGRARSADTILPDLQEPRKGDLLPAIAGATRAYRVVAVERFRGLVLAAPAADGDDRPLMTWELRLSPARPGLTRLLARTRFDAAWTEHMRNGGAPGAPALIARFGRPLARLPGPLLLPAALIGHRALEAAILRGIKRRAERTLEPARIASDPRPLVDRLLPRAAVAELRRTPGPLREPNSLTRSAPAHGQPAASGASGALS